VDNKDCEGGNSVGVMVPSLAETWVPSNENVDTPHPSTFSHVFDNRSYWIPGSWHWRMLCTDNILCPNP